MTSIGAANTGVVTAAELNLRSSPSSATKENVIKKLLKGKLVRILDEQDEWLKVSVDGQSGFVSSHFIQQQQETPLPNAEPGSGASHQSEVGPEPAHGVCKFVGDKAIAPDGTQFGKKFKLGVFNFGKTGISQFVGKHQDRFTGIAPSRLRIMQAVSDNEGNLEAINTWDNAFLTFGIFQWTVGAGSGAGELPSLLHRLKRTSPTIFQRYFGQFGLDVSVSASSSGAVPVGFFTLDGTLLKDPAQKERLRTLDWAYRFWLSGHDGTVRQIQVEHAMDRVDLFYRNMKCVIGERFVCDYVSSELGVALLLDQHVNRPGHVPGTLSRAVAKCVAEFGGDNPQAWKDAQEQRLLDLYVQLRGETNMTDSIKRADTIRKAVKTGLASDRRGSYQI